MRRLQENISLDGTQEHKVLGVYQPSIKDLCRKTHKSLYKVKDKNYL